MNIGRIIGFNGGTMQRGTIKIQWKRLPGFKLQAYVEDVAPRGFEIGIRERDMDPIQEWSDKNSCGVRISFNTWKFKKPKEMTVFLLKWS